ATVASKIRCLTPWRESDTWRRAKCAAAASRMRCLTPWRASDTWHRSGIFQCCPARAGHWQWVAGSVQALAAGPLARRTFGGFDGIDQQHGDRHGADAARHGGDGAGHFAGRGEVYVAAQLAVGAAVDAHV